VLLLTLAASTVPAQPSVSEYGIVNAASNALVGWPNSSIAQGSIFSIYGSGLGPSASPGLHYPLQNTLAGVSVQVISGNVSVNAIPLFVSPGLINAILPENTAAGTAALTVIYNGQTSNAVSFQVVAHSFGIFTVGSSPNGAGIITGMGGLYSVNAPAKPGDAASIWGTGIGASPGDNGTAPPPQVDMPSLPLTVYVGGQDAEVVYRGRSGFPGEDQINFTVPGGVTGCYIPVAVLIGNVVSNFATMPIAPAGEKCPDPAPSGPNDPAGNITLLRSKAIVGNSADWGFASFGEPQWFEPLPTQPVFGWPFYLQVSLPPGACIGGIAVSPFIDVLGAALDAGPITITGPNGSRQLNLGFAVYYSMLLGGGPGQHAPPFYLEAGDYSVSSPGGPDVGAFSQSFTIPEPISWTNADAIQSVDRSAGVQVTWSGGDPNGTVQISGAFGTFICTARTSDQRFTVPPLVLLSVPASGGTPESFILSSTSSTAFSAPGINSGSIDSTVMITKKVAYQ
jgi:uncharacterized protein (TIGR03437 family)